MRVHVAMVWMAAGFGCNGDPTKPLETGATTSDPTTLTGLVSPVAGDLVITEIMPDPLAVDGNFGEYIEVTSASANNLDLVGLSVLDGSATGFTVTGGLALAAGGVVVFAPSANQGANGGLPVDYAYNVADLKLDNAGDTVTLQFSGSTLDEVVYSASAPWPTGNGATGTGLGVLEGSSLSLDPGSTDPASNDDGAHWCHATTTFGDGDHGTPGAPNDPC